MEAQPPAVPGDTTPVQLPRDYMKLPTGRRLTIVKGLMESGERPETLVGRMTTTFSGGDPAVVSALTAVLELETDATIRKMALQGLTRSGDPAAIPGLLRGLESDNHASRWIAIHGLEQLRASEGVPGLIRLLNDRRSRKKAAKALVAIGDERGLEPLREAADHGSPLARGKLRRYAGELEAALAHE